MKPNKAIHIILTLVVWVVVLVFPLIFFPYKRSASPWDSERFVAWYVYCNIFLMGFYFLNNLWLIPTFLAQKKMLLYIGAILFIFIVFLLGFETIASHFIANRKNLPPPGRFHKPFILISPIALFLIVFLLSSFAKIVTGWFLAETQKERVEKQNLAIELNMLKAQINPHFLFNTLNSIYALALSNKEETAIAVMRLSKIMRYTLEEASSDKVSLEKEIEFINSYINLQKIRLGEHVSIAFQHNVKNPITLIAPFLFMPFIENAFKYGISTHEQATIHITIEQCNHTISFTCTNMLFSYNHFNKGVGSGIANVKRRLQLLYPEKHKLHIEEQNALFAVKLKLMLDK